MDFSRTFRFQVKNALKRIYVGSIHNFPGYTANLASPVKLGLRMFDVTCTALEMVMLAHARPSGNISCLA